LGGVGVIPSQGEETADDTKSGKKEGNKEEKGKRVVTLKTTAQGKEDNKGEVEIAHFRDRKGKKQVGKWAKGWTGPTQNQRGTSHGTLITREGQ